MAKMKLYKAKELADILGIDAHTIYRLGQTGEIESYKVGKSVRFPMPEKRGQNNETNTSGKNNRLHQ